MQCQRVDSTESIGVSTPLRAFADGGRSLHCTRCSCHRAYSGSDRTCSAPLLLLRLLLSRPSFLFAMWLSTAAVGWNGLHRIGSALSPLSFPAAV